ncbi:MAG: class I SAM-dependent methyltransferase [Planctomycetota bacterium]|jgi:phospholipid N-methyltransferase
MLTRDSISFLGAVMRNPTRVGAIAPSSPALARAMTDGLELTSFKTVVELGPGTGPFTQRLAEVMPDHARYLGIERDPKLVNLLRQRLPAMRVAHGSAEDMRQHLHDADLSDVGVILSGLPFASLPGVVQDGVIEAVEDLMAPGVVFRTFQYVHAWPLPTARRFRERMDGRLGSHTLSRPVLRNMPPAYVLTWGG